MIQFITNSRLYVLMCGLLERRLAEFNARQEYEYGIAEAIGRAYPFEPMDIWRAYGILKSWDNVICLCEYCTLYGFSNVYHSIGIFLERADGRAFRAEYWRQKERDRMGDT